MWSSRLTIDTKLPVATPRSDGGFCRTTVLRAARVTVSTYRPGHTPTVAVQNAIRPRPPYVQSYFPRGAGGSEEA